MITLEKFYPLISRNAFVTLTNKKLDKTYYEGKISDIPPVFDECKVIDFCMSNNGDILFKIEA